MATLTINQYTLTPLNPDGTTNTNLPILSGALPPTESVDFASMGQKFKLELECALSGTYSDSTTADLAGTYIRYNPAMFVEPYSKYPLQGSFPNAGYLIQIPTTTAGTYNMPLSFITGEFSQCNENGVVTIAVTSATEFTITHNFMITDDFEGYLTGRYIDNQTRLTKNSIYNAIELTNDRPTVFGSQKALNALVATKQRNYTLFATELSLLFSASFNGYDQDGDAVLPCSVTFERDSTTVDSISSIEDTQVVVKWTDSGAAIDIDEAVVIITKRTGAANVAGYEKDLQVISAKLATTGSTATIDQMIKGPVTYSQSGGETELTFFVDHTKVDLATDYDIHIIALYDRGPSDKSTVHNVKKTTTIDFDSLPVDFDMDAEFYSRNGNHANNFTATVMERISNVLTIDKADYNTNASPPCTTFDQDAAFVQFQLTNTAGTVIYEGIIGKNTSDNSWTDTAQISATEDGDNILFTANDFRIGYENFQGLVNMGPEDSNQYKWKWSIQFVASADDRFRYQFEFDQTLTIRPYENNSTPSEEPSGAPKVSNIRFIDPNTGLLIGNWCDLTTVLVVADVEDLGTDTYVNAFVDRYPLGATMQNDYALEEEDSAEHTLPAYIELPQLESSLVSNLTVNPVDGVVSFLLDVTTLQGDVKFRISIMTYKAS